jgi:hypothetical protein
MFKKGSLKQEIDYLKKLMYTLSRSSSVADPPASIQVPDLPDQEHEDHKDDRSEEVL